MPSKDRGAVLCRALHVAIGGDADVAADLFSPDVKGWSPTMVVASRAELLDALATREDALTDVVLTVDALDVIGDKAIAEWHATAAFTGPFLVDEDVLIEPNGQLLAVAGVTVAEFDGDRICGFRNYFDDAALLEQMLIST